MFARLRENWQYKLLALAGGILLHFYVQSQQDPSQTRILPVQVAVRNLPADLLMTSRLNPISVSVTGTAEEINRLTDQNVTASIDLARARAGVNADIPVDVDLVPAGIRTVVTISDRHPGSLTLQLAERRRRRMSVAAVLTGALAPGYSTSNPSVVPTMATVVGAADEVDSVSKLVIRADVTGATDNIEDDFQIVPIDAAGNDVPDVKVKPDFAHVQIGVLHSGLTKDVFVSPVIVGAPQLGYMIGGVNTTPATVPLTGPNTQLSAIGQIATEPVDVQGASADVTRVVKCIAPTGGTLTSQGNTVTVHVRVLPVPGVSAPAAKSGGPTPATQPQTRSKSSPGA